MDSEQLEVILKSILDNLSELDSEARHEFGFYEADDLENSTTISFEDAGLFTNDDGVVIRLDDGTEFQITIIQVR